MRNHVPVIEQDPTALPLAEQRPLPMLVAQFFANRIRNRRRLSFAVCRNDDQIIRVRALTLEIDHGDAVTLLVLCRDRGGERLLFGFYGVSPLLD
jgi:hypothetical protein